MPRIRAFVNARVCSHGKETLQDLFVDLESGCFVQDPDEKPTTLIDLQGQILAPAFQELQINGCLGIHFTSFENPQSYLENLATVSRHLATQGVGAFYVTIPTVSPDVFKKILPYLRPRSFTGGADLLGAHCEGPWLNCLKKGAHDQNLLRKPADSSAECVYGEGAAFSTIKMITLAPELIGSQELIQSLTEQNLIVALGHSASDIDTGQRGLRSGARMLTHVFNAMNPLNHRQPGLAGLISVPDAPYYSIIADGIHLHPSIVSLAFRANPNKCILITDAIELAGLPDGTYPGHAQIPHIQEKKGSRVTIQGTDTLIGSCSSIEQCVMNLQKWSECSLAEAVCCASENIANLMGDRERGFIEVGRKADFIILKNTGRVVQTWMRGEKIFDLDHPVLPSHMMQG